MQQYDYNGYTFILREMSRKAALDCTVKFQQWFDTLLQPGELERLTFISTLLLTNTPLTVKRGDEVLQPGTHDLGDGVMLTLPLTEAGIDELPASLVGWMNNAAGEENAYLLENFLSGLTRMAKTLSGLASVNGQPSVQ